jgi:hypothetical protein
MGKNKSVIKHQKVFTKVQKSSAQKQAKSTLIESEPVTINTTPIAKGSLETLEKQTSFFLPGDSFGRLPSRRKSHKKEIGYPGLEVYGGYVHEEMLSELQGRKGIQLYEEMRKNDSIVGAMLLVASQLIHNASVEVDPSEQNPEAQESLEAQELVRSALFDMGETWTDTLSEILTFLDFGFSVCSVWHRQRNGYHRDKWKSSRYTDNKWGWAGISLRSQTTLERWEIDKKGRAVGMVQNGPPVWDSTLVPFSHAGHFRTRTERDNPEGLSVLRNCYRSYWIKRHLEETESIGIERDLAGLPVLTVPQGLDLWNTNDPEAAATLTRAENIVRLARLDKYGGIVLPFGWDLKLMTTPGQRAHNSDKVISRWDQRIAVTLLADMLLIGQQNVGSFALVQGKIKLFSSALESYAARIAGVFNRDLIPRMMVLNGIAQEYWPTLKFGPVETPSLIDLADYIKELTGAGVNVDEAMALYLRQVAGFPPPRKGDKAMGEQPKPGGEESPDGDGSEEETPPAEPNEEDEAGAKKGFIIRNDPMSRYSVGID